MSSFKVVFPLVASCLWLAGCGARSGVQCFSDVCLDDEALGRDPMGSANPPTGTNDPTRPPGAATDAPSRPSRPSRPGEMPSPPDGPSPDPMPSPPDRPPEMRPTSGRCTESGTIEGPISVRTRAALAELEGCRVVEGDLLIGRLATPDLQPLRSLQVVTGVLGLNVSGSLSGLESLSSVGALSLNDIDVPTLEPLGNLTALTVDGHLSIYGSTGLRSLAGLGGLRVLGSISIGQNPNLETLDGLRLAGHVEQITIESNRNLADLAGLADVTSVGTLNIRNNDSMPQLRGLERLENASLLLLEDNTALVDASALGQLRVVGTLSISNVGLSNLDGFSGLRDVGALAILSNVELTQVDALRGLVALAELTVVGNPRLEQLPSFGAITNIQRVLLLDNATLRSGPAFPNLRDATSLAIIGNPQLTRVDGFSELRTMTDLEVSNNRGLVALQLPALQDLGGSRISCNPNLPEASLEPLLAFGNADIGGNLGSSITCDPSLLP